MSIYSRPLFMVPSFHYSNIPIIPLQFFIDPDGADVVPFPFIYDDPTDGTHFFLDPFDKDFDDGFGFANFEKIEKGCLHGVDAGELAALNFGVSQGVPQDVPEITDFTGLIEGDVKKGTSASQGKRHLRSLLFMSLQESLQREVRHDIAVMAEDGLVLVEEILNIFQSARRVQKGWFVAKNNGDTAPSPLRKFLRIKFRGMMRVHDEAIHADGQEMIHHIGDDGLSSDVQEGLWMSLRQRAKP